jgi:hypothetical protein
MLSDLDAGQWTVIALSAFLFIWFILASSANRSRGIATYRWLRQGMESLGRISNAEWIGASNMGARLVVANPAKPFGRIEAHYLLEPREFLPYWLFSYLRGKRDEVVIKIALRMTPKGSMEIHRLSGRKTMPSGERIQQNFRIAQADLENAPWMAGVEAFLKENNSTINKLLLRSQPPHIELHARLRPLLASAPESYFDQIRRWYQPSGS